MGRRDGSSATVGGYQLRWAWKRTWPRRVRDAAAIDVAVRANDDEDPAFAVHSLGLDGRWRAPGLLRSARRPPGKARGRAPGSHGRIRRIAGDLDALATPRAPALALRRRAGARLLPNVGGAGVGIARAR